MPTLHLGVIDVPYVEAPSKRQRKARAGTVTTGDVATWLENRYHVMEHFAQLHEQDIATDLASSLAGALESFMMGAPVSHDAFGSAASSIEDRMKNMIAMAELDALGYPGIPTQAAQDRASGKKRSSRFKRKRGTNSKPVSFYDTGLYFASLRSWID